MRERAKIGGKEEREREIIIYRNTVTATKNTLIINLTCILFLLPAAACANIFVIFFIFSELVLDTKDPRPLSSSDRLAMSSRSTVRESDCDS